MFLIKLWPPSVLFYSFSVCHPFTLIITSLRCHPQIKYYQVHFCLKHLYPCKSKSKLISGNLQSLVHLVFSQGVIPSLHSAPKSLYNIISISSSCGLFRLFIFVVHLVLYRILHKANQVLSLLNVGSHKYTTHCSQFKVLKNIISTFFNKLYQLKKSFSIITQSSCILAAYSSIIYQTLC